MPLTAPPRAQPPFTYSLVLPHVVLDSKGQSGPDGGGDVAGRLYFTTPAAQPTRREDPRAVVAAVCDAIEGTEQRRCALHRVQVAPLQAAPAEAGPQAVLYAERVNDVNDDRDNDSESCSAVLTACPALFEREMSAEQSHEAATVAPLCIFEDVCGSDTTRAVFWRFLGSVLRHGIREGTGAASVAGVRGRVVSAFERAGGRAFCLDAFAGDGEEGSLAGASAARVVAVDSAASVESALQHLHGACARAEKRRGAALLVVEITWRRLKDLRPPSAQTAAHGERRSCLVWLPHTPHGRNADGVYAAAALEMLLDELVLAAAPPLEEDEAAAVLCEAGVQQLLSSCQLTRSLAEPLRGCAAQRCREGRPLFHWVVCAPPSATGRLDSRVSRRTFAEGIDDFWDAVEALEHWKDLAAVADSLVAAAAPVAAAETPPTAAAAEPVSPPSLSSTLRQRSRVSRQRRAIRQSGHHGQSASGDGSVLARQRRKMNVQKLYGGEEGEEATGASSLESSLVGSGTFHRTRSSPASSFSGNSLLDAEETLGRNTRRTVRLMKRIHKPAATADDEL